MSTITSELSIYAREAVFADVSFALGVIALSVILIMSIILFRSLP